MPDPQDHDAILSCGVTHDIVPNHELPDLWDFVQSLAETGLVSQRAEGSRNPCAHLGGGTRVMLGDEVMQVDEVAIRAAGEL